jgi:hypothetical protein
VADLAVGSAIDKHPIIVKFSMSTKAHYSIDNQMCPIIWHARFVHNRAGDILHLLDQQTRSITCKKIDFFALISNLEPILG